MAGASACHITPQCQYDERGAIIGSLCPTRRVSVKGRAGDEAVLCTTDETYALRLAEATNTLVRLRIAHVCPASLR
jgi:hypothetical protein|eukprot:COSAG02_NODE_339_length_24201_cov_45.538462_14_plen_76_part_00